ncbi:hypothetical protein D9Q98_006162 [Chlorella vulgaris]|uniref:Uncharacterized protein n=1 Tax=Chlorella vulgaris TaxID=3077 RepID=A0A9D4TX24_CHLVU|nr:hypothetical protein D9Q98_006162 [Chlorella vulgaris]
MSDEYDAEEAVEKRASYVRDNLPAALPFEAPSYLVQHMELADNGKQISWPKAFFLVVGDSVSDEMCLRTEIYYLLMKYKIIIDCATFVAIFGCLNWQKYMDYVDETCPACGSFANKQNWNWLYQAFVVVLIVVQLLSFLAYFYGTLQVEEKGLITLNKSLEAKESGKFDRNVWTDFFYSNDVHGSGSVVDFEEKEILDWAVRRYSQLPWQFKLWNPCRQDTKEAHVAQALSEWKERGTDDLRCIHQAYLGNEYFAWHDDDHPGNWLMEHLVYRNLWGFCLLKTLMLHPDFSAAHAALRGLARWNATKVVLSVLYMLAVEAFVIYWAWGTWI